MMGGGAEYPAFEGIAHVIRDCSGGISRGDREWMAGANRQLSRPHAVFIRDVVTQAVESAMTGDLHNAYLARDRAGLLADAVETWALRSTVERDEARRLVAGLRVRVSELEAALGLGDAATE